jgi:hypothetical protein
MRVEMRLDVGELLLKENRIAPWQLGDARTCQKQSGVTLTKALVSLGFVAEDEITGLVARRCGVPSVNLDPATVDPAMIEAIPAEMARTYAVLPLWRSAATLTIAMADPTNGLALEHVRLVTGYEVKPVVASESALENAIGLWYGPPRPAPSRRGTALATECARCERTAWQYVIAMHAAAVGGARRPIRGIVEDVEDMRARLTRERDEARARVAELERQVAEARLPAASVRAARVRGEDRRPPTVPPPRPGRPPSAPPG